MPGLISSLRRVAVDTFEVDAVAASARGWLFEHRYVTLPSRRLRQLALAARRHHDAIVLAMIEATGTAEVRSEWMPRLLEMIGPDAGVSRLDWLRAGRCRRSLRGWLTISPKCRF